MAQQMRQFEGRELPNQKDDLEDQGLGFDIGTVLSRRKVLGFLGIAGGSVALAACSPSGTSSAASSSTSSAAASTTASSTTSAAAAALTEMKSETQGPLPRRWVQWPRRFGSFRRRAF